MTPNYKTITSTTQDFLDIFDISNNMVILKDGSASMILTVSAMNFGLLAEEEQDAVIYTYAALLNSLNYSIQIVIESKTKDVTSYLHKLQQQEQKASNQKKRTMIVKYRQFVGQLIKERNVLDKKFYVVVPAASIEMGFLPPSSVLPGSKPFDVSSIEKNTVIEKALSILEPRRDHLLAQFNRIGLFARQLDTQEIIKVFYANYNPEAEGQHLTDTNNYTTSLVRASMTESLMNNPNQQQPQPQATAEPSAPAIMQQPAQQANPINDLNQPNTQPSTPSPEEQQPQPVVNQQPATQQQAVLQQQPVQAPQVVQQPVTPPKVQVEQKEQQPAQTPNDIQNAIDSSLKEISSPDQAGQIEQTTPDISTVQPSAQPQIQSTPAIGIQEEITPLERKNDNPTPAGGLPPLPEVK